VTRKRLGRGLDALLSSDPNAGTGAGVAGDGQRAEQSAPGDVAIDDVVRGRYQPRRHFSEASLEELAASIRAQGLMQPIVVRPSSSYVTRSVRSASSCMYARTSG